MLIHKSRSQVPTQRKIFSRILIFIVFKYSLATPFEQQERNYFSELNKSSILLLAQLIKATKYGTAPYIQLLVSCLGTILRQNNKHRMK